MKHSDLCASGLPSDRGRKNRLMVALLLLLGAASCSSPERADLHQGHANPDSLSESCQTGESRPCSLHLSEDSGAVTCYEGTARCEDGHFGACGDGVILRKPLSERFLGDRGIASQSGAPVSCANPCDPACSHWLENGPLTGNSETIPNYPGHPPAQACSHALCTTGPALNASCDPCAATVCAADATCCGASGGTWDSTCVDSVYRLCLNQPPPISLCDLGLYSASNNQMTVTGLGTSSNITIGALGNVTFSSGQGVRRIITQGPVYLNNDQFPPLGVVAGSNITINAPSVNSPVGPLESGGKVELYGYPRVNGSVLARGDIVWEGRIYGNAKAGGTVNLNGGCAANVFGGSCTNGSPHAAPTITLPALPPQTFTCPGGVSVNTNTSHTLTPGSYGDVYVDGTLTLNGEGTYTFNKLYVKTLRLAGPTSGTRYNIQSCNEMNVLTNGQVVDAANVLLTDPSRLFVSVKGNLHFDSNVDWVGVILAGSSGTKSGGSIRGAIWAKPVNDLNGQTSIVGIGREECISMGIGGTTPPACPIPNTTPGTPAALRTPCSSGLDCQINHRCTAPKTVLCGHSKCMAGGPLGSTCDPCVERICAATPSCCSTAWSDSCVAAVARVCDASCAEPGGGACSAALCVAPPAGDSICDFAVRSDGSTTLSAGTSVAPRPTIFGNAGAKGALSLNWSDVAGDLYMNGAFSPVASTYTNAENALQPSLFASETFTCPGTDGAPSAGSIGPGNYGAVTVPAGSTLTLTPGTYTFTSLTLASESSGAVATLALPPSGKVTVLLCATPASVTFGKDSRITGLSHATALNFSLYAKGSVTATNSTALYGYLRSETNVTLNGSTLHGIVNSANTLVIGPGSSVDATGLRDACFRSRYDASVTLDPLTAPPESGTCKPNTPSYMDPTCPGYDLALGIPCGNRVPVCNHGTATFSGPVKVGYYPDADRHMSEASPPTPTGECNGSLTIAPGACADLTCAPALPSGLLTMMVDPGHLLSECGAEKRYLDNWTVHDGRTCTSATVSQTFSYDATCATPGTAARWGLLTWKGDVLGDAKIEFFARTGRGATPAAATANAALAPFALLATADASHATCTAFGPTPCPIDITKTLALGLSQGSHLDLRVDLTSSPPNAPELDEWQVSYTCVFDQ